MAVDGSGNIYVTGRTNSADFPTASALQGTRQDAPFSDGFVSKLDSTGSLVYSTYLGGDNFDFPRGIDVDSSGNAYVTGSTFSTNFPTASAAQGANGGSRDAFMTKLTAAGALSVSTYIGGSGNELGNAVAVDSAGNPFVVGETASADLPTVAAAQGALSGSTDAFIVGYTTAGVVNFATYHGGTGDEQALGVDVNTSGEAWVSGETDSADLPTASPFQGASGGGQDAFVGRFTAAGARTYSTYLGGSGTESGNAIAVDGSDQPIVTGDTGSANFPTQTPFQAALAGGVDAFVTKFNAAGSALLYSTYLGGTGNDTGFGVDSAADGVAYFVGNTTSSDFPTVSPIDGTFAGNDAFIAEVDTAGTVSFADFLGGTGAEQGRGVARGPSNIVVVTGNTLSNDFTTTAGAVSAALSGTQDAFVTRFDFSPAGGGGAPPNPARDAAQERQVSRAGQAPPGVEAGALPPPTVAAGGEPAAGTPAAAAGGLTQSESGRRVEAAVRTLRSDGFDSVSLFIRGITDFTLGEQRAVFQSVPVGQVLTALSQSNDPTAQGLVGTFRQVAEGGGPSFAEFAASLNRDGVAGARAQTYIAIYLRSAEVPRDALFATAVEGLAVDPGVAAAVAPTVEGALAGDTLTGAVQVATAGDASVVSGTVDGEAGVATVLVGNSPVAVDDTGAFQVDLESTAAATEDITITVVRADGSISERTLFETPSAANRLFETGGLLSLDSGGRLTATGRLEDPRTVRRILVNGQAVAVAADGSFRFDAAVAGDAEFAVVTVSRVDGTQERHRIAIATQSPVVDLVSTADASGSLFSRGTVGDAARVVRILVDGQPVDLTADGGFSFRLSDTALAGRAAVPVTIVYVDGSRAEESLAVGRQVGLIGVETFVTAGGLRITEGRLEAGDGVAEVRIGGQPVEVAVDGTFVVAASTAAAAEDAFVTATIVYADGSVTAQRIGPTPEPLIVDVDRQTADDGSIVAEARVDDPEDVVEVRFGDQPVTVAADGSFSLSLAADQADQEISITVVFADGTVKTQRIATPDRAVVADLRPVTVEDGGQAAAGRVSNPEDVAQVLVDGTRVAVATDGSFVYPFAEAGVAAAVDLTIVFTDGSRLDRNLAVRERAPFSTLQTVAAADGTPRAVGVLSDPGDVAEVRIAGRTVAVAADGSFSVAIAETAAAETIVVTIVRVDGSRSEQRITVTPSAAIADLQPVLDADGGLAIVDGVARAAGAVADPETVAEVRVEGQDVAIAADGSFVIQVSEQVVSVDDSVSITIIYKNGARIDQQLALVATPLTTPLQTVVTADGTTLATGTVGSLEGVATVMVDGRTVEVADDGAFQFEVAAAAGEAAEAKAAVAVATGSVSVTIIYADGSRSERQVAVDSVPLLTAAETVVAADGSIRLAGALADLEDVASVLVGDTPVTVGDDGSVEIVLDRTLVEVDRSVSITIVFEDGSRSVQRLAVGTGAAFESVRAVTGAAGGSVLEGTLERNQDIAVLRVGGRVVPVAEDGSFSAGLLGALETGSGSVAVTIVYKDGSRTDQQVALRNSVPIAAEDSVVALGGGTVASWRLTESEGVAEVRIDGQTVAVQEDGSFSLALAETQAMVDESVSITIVYADGSRLEQRLAVAQQAAVAATEGVSVSATSRVVEGQVADVERVAQVLVDGQPFAINADGSFRLDLAQAAADAGGSVSLTVVYADGSRKVQRLGVTAETLFQSLDSFTTTEGAVVAAGRIADAEDVARVIIDGREVSVAGDGSFEVEVAAADGVIGRDLSVTVVYEDGARVARQVTTRSDSILRSLDTVIAADGRNVIEGRLDPGAAVASVSFGGAPVAVAADGTFRLVLADAAVQSTAQRTLQVVYADGGRQTKNLVVSTEGVVRSLDTYAARDGGAVVEATLANPQTVASVFVDGQRVALDEGGGFVFRRSVADAIQATDATVRVVHKDGSIAGRRIAMSVDADRPSMLVTNVQQTADGFAISEARIANAGRIASLEIGGNPVNVGADGRVVYWIRSDPSGQPARVAVRIVYRNGLNAETWITANDPVGAAVPLPRQPRKVALVVGNGRYGGGIPSLNTAVADAGLVGNMFETRFGYEARQLRDPSKGELMGALQRLGRELGRNDQLAVYYAGQSHTEPRTGQSFWLPRDAEATTARNWISGDRIYRTLDRMGVGRALLLADSSFNVSAATGILRAGGAEAGPRVRVVASATGRPVRATPGDSHSAFAWQIASALTDVADETPPQDVLRVVGERMRRSGPLPTFPGPLAAAGAGAPAQ